MANDAAIFIGWNRAVAGRENDALELFAHTINFWQGQIKAGNATSFEPVILRPHGGDLNGFFLIRGDRNKLNTVKESDEFLAIVSRAILLLEGVGVNDAY